MKKNNYFLFFVFSIMAFSNIAFAQTKINEAYSRGTAADPDWIEIYNTGISSIDISGYKIYDSGGQTGSKPKKEFPSGTIIPANGFFVIVTDDTTDSGFGLSSGGEWVWLENNNGVVIDSVSIPTLGVDTSYGRKPDGSENLQKLSPMTKGTSNNFAVQVFVKMNEAYSRGTATDPDWIEVFNTSSSAIDLSGYKIYDNGGQSGSKPKKEFPAGTSIPGNGFFVIVVDDADPSGFGISSGGETVWFENANGTVIDSFNIPALGTDTSYGRKPDGSNNLQKLTPTTKGISNTVTATSVIKMNEAYSRGTASDPDWIEVYNSSSASVDISGYQIYDNGGQSGSKPKKTFPNGTVIPANGFFVIVVDDADPSGFGISSGGETVWLENAAGAVIDSLPIPALGVDTSFGRKPDGSNNLEKLFPVTKGSSNGGGTDVSDVNEIKDFSLLQNFPNPFNPSTSIKYQLPKGEFVSLKVYDILGNEVASLVNELQNSGTYNVTFEAGKLSSGVYFYQLRAGEFVSSRKLILMK